MFHVLLDGNKVNVTPKDLAECCQIIEVMAGLFSGHRLTLMEAQPTCQH